MQMLHIFLIYASSTAVIDNVETVTMGGEMLTQAEADSMIAMTKSFTHATTLSIDPGTDLSLDLTGDDGREKFLLDIWRGTLRMSKIKYQNRGRSVIVLVRLDIDGSPHTNPDGTTVGRSHLHVYREGFEDKWAYNIDIDNFPDIENIESSFLDFCRYCHIENIPPFQGGLQI